MKTNKPQYLHVSDKGKPLPTAENLEQLLIIALVIDKDLNVYLNGKKIPVDVYEIQRPKKYANRIWILHLKNLATIHGLPHDAIDYLPLIDLNQFVDVSA
jgi:hypothetical protein